MDVKIAAVVAPKVTFASHQNSVPVLRELKIENIGEHALEGLRVDIESAPQVLLPKRWPIDRINVGATGEIRDLDVELNATLLLELQEAVSATVTIRVMHDETELAVATFPLEALAQNEWGGAAMPELLAAFVMHNDPAIDGLLKDAARVLISAGKTDGFNGYTDGSATRVWEVASAIWSAVAARGLTYALPPSSFEICGQKIRPPSAVLSGGLGTCLDTACLFAAALEQAGLNPIVVLTKDHAFAGVWLQPAPFAEILTEDAETLRKRVRLQELIVFETTLCSQKPPPSFSAAIRAADNQIAENVEAEFVHALDVRRARMHRLRPLSLRLDAGARGSGVDVGEPRVSESLEEAPLLPGFAPPRMEAIAETGPSRLRDWRRKLLDLSLRNRLLNVTPNKTALKLVCPSLASLEDRLSGGAKIRIVAAPAMDTAGRDSALHERRTGEQLLAAYAAEALARDEVLSPLGEKDLQAALIELYRKTKSDLQEGGANTLFLAVGFLSWKREPEDIKSYRAPLILMPVTLERKTARSDVRMTAHEDKPRFNGTLLEMLRQDFELNDLDPFEGALPHDDSGVDVAAVLTAARRAVRDIRGFEVVEEAMLGAFSFAKYLMWKDLTERADQLLENRVVKHLLETPRESFPCDYEIPRPSELDILIDPKSLFTPLPADSSQLAAVIASARGCDFVLDGPPGTGKSQTIANIIAHNLALGRKVLFVAEKMAALNVVHSRLEAKGLGPFCLELHSSKANKADVIRQLGRAWDTLEEAPSETWVREADRLKVLRDELNLVVALLHAPQPGGMSLHQAIGIVVRDGDGGTPEFTWSTARELDARTLLTMRDVAKRLDLNAQNIAGIDRAAFNWVGCDDWSPSWQASLVETSIELARAARDLEAVHGDLCASLKINAGTEAESLAALDMLSEALGTASGLDLTFVFSTDAALTSADTRAGLAKLNSYRSLERSLSVPYAPNPCRQIAIAELQTQWTTAGAKFWPFSMLRRSKVRRALSATGGCTKPDPGRDLPTLFRMAEELTALNMFEPRARAVPGWAALATRDEEVERALSAASALSAAIARLAHSADQLATLTKAVRVAVVEANLLLAEAMPLGRLIGAYRRALRSHGAALANFRSAAETPQTLGETVGLSNIIATAEALLTARTSINAWSGWVRVRNEALELDLSALVASLERGGLGVRGAAGGFEVGYASWLAKMLLEREPTLRRFIPAEHEGRIADFRRLDDELAELSSVAIRAMLSSQIPRRDDRRLGKGYGALRYQLGLKAPRKALRELAAEMGDALTTLTPCLLMSPQSVAQYLPADSALFDLVIFDEASQITPWDAIGAIARGRQVIVAGDPKQMPPTNFFNRNTSTEGDEADGNEPDQESILEQCLSANLPHHRLVWHYRSRHESLIAFSNHRYYDDELITFPAAFTRDSAVSFRKVEGVYAKGKGRTNAEEAKALVAEIVRRLGDPSFVDEAGHRLSLGAITLNSEQQKLVEDLLDRERQQHPELEPFFDETLAEPVIVKNLESIQGDERDLILLGVGYGPDVLRGADMSMNFGPLNRDGGWRRWNVAITRARREMILFASFNGGMIDINRSRARAVKDLRDYQDFAIRGMRALPQADHGSVGGYESPFEMAVARGLRDKGWEVRTQIGASRFRIDLGVVHPDLPGNYLAGVECDGAAYHSAATARDRDKVRESILRGLGWDLIRVWSTDWWHDRANALAKLDARLGQKLAESRAANASAAPPPDDVSNDVNPDVEVGPTAPTTSRLAPLLARDFQMPNSLSGPRFRRSDLSRFRAVLRPEHFYDISYDPILRELVAFIVKTEAPLLDDVLVERIARAHGYQRSGRVIRDRILKLKGRPFIRFEDPAGGKFVWPDSGAREHWSLCRLPDSEDDIRPIEEIASEELRAGVRYITAPDIPWELSRRLGIRRLTAAARSRIMTAIEGLVPQEV